MATSKSQDESVEKKPTRRKSSAKSTPSEKKPTRKADSKKPRSKAQPLEAENMAEMMEDESEDTTSSKRSKKQPSLGSRVREIVTQKKVYIPVLAIAALALLAYGAYKTLVIAVVGMQPITKLDLYDRMVKQNGSELTEQLINEKLVLNEAQKRGAVATPEEIDKEMAKIEQQQGGKQQLEAALTMRQMTLDDLRQQLKFNVLINKMFGNVQVDEKELNDFIEQNKAQLESDPSGATSSADIRQKAQESLKQQKVNKSFSEWLQNAQKSSDVRRV